jgi:peptidyl-prolyl cis-trans isomerase C
MKRLRLVVLSICLGVVCLLLLVSSLTWADKSAKNDKIVAKAGKQVLTVEALDQRVNSLPPEYQKMIRQNPQFKQNLIDRWVQISLLSQEARARKLDRNKALAEKINELVDTVLAQEFVTKYVFDKIKVTDKEIANYYSEHKAEFEEPEMVKARHILVRVSSEAKPDDWGAAETRIREIKKRLDGGEDFAAVAQASSEDPGSKDKGGELGFFPRGQMVPEFEKAAFALRTGEVSEPVKTAFGYHIIKAEDRKEAKTKVFDEVKEEVKNRLIETKQEEAMGKLFLELKNKYGVTITP